MQRLQADNTKMLLIKERYNPRNHVTKCWFMSLAVLRVEITNTLFSIPTACYGIIFTGTVVLHTYVNIWPSGLTECLKTDTHKQTSRPHTLNHIVVSDTTEVVIWPLVCLNYRISFTKVFFHKVINSISDKHVI